MLTNYEKTISFIVSDILLKQYGYEFVDDETKKDFILEEIISNLDVWKELDKVVTNAVSIGKYTKKI